jgi:hypothetical protein
MKANLRLLRSAIGIVVLMTGLASTMLPASAQVRGQRYWAPQNDIDDSRDRHDNRGGNFGGAG